MPKQTLTVTTLAPDFELTDTRGKSIRLQDYRGRLLVLVLLRGFM